ncbi:MAG: ABC transporter ATP-binding protein [Acidimicrobiia bacterium]
MTVAPPGDPALVPNATVEVSQVSKWFGQKVAVSEVTCSFGPGITGLLGPNGAGKTTLLRMLTGLLLPSGGSVAVLGRSPRQAVDVYRSIGLVPEENAVYPAYTGLDFVKLAGELTGVADPEGKARAALAAVDLVDDADRAVGGYSKGMRQRAKVAAALIHEPEILVLDEPLNGTDPVQRAHLIALFRRLADEGRTVIVSSHVLQEVERMTDRVLAIVDGKLAAAGDIAAIRRAMTDIPFRVVVTTDEPRRLGRELLGIDVVNGVTLDQRKVHVETSDLAGLGARLPALARDLDIRLTGFRPDDESLESVFRYLVRKR